MKAIRTWLLATGLGLYLIWCFIPSAKTPSVIYNNGKSKNFGPTLAYAQGSQTIYQTLVSSGTAPTITSITNIGQSGHLVQLKFVNASGHTCTSPATSVIAFQAGLQSSFDGSTWNNLGPLITVTDSNLNISFVAYGAFPQIRLNYYTGDNTNCRLNAFYTGIIPTAAMSGMQTLYNTYLIHEERAFTTASATSVIAVPTSPTSAIWGVYGLSIVSSADQEIKLIEDVGGSNVIHLDIFAKAGVQYSYPLGVLAHFASAVPSKALSYQQSTTSQAFMNLEYRWE